MPSSISGVVNQMNSSISPFKPWLWALLGLIAIELVYYGVTRPPRIAWNSFLDFQFAQTESFQRLVAHDKIIAFENVDADIIQVGDSSGLHGVQPPVAMSHIPGWRYLNLGVATNLGYPGYYNLAKLQLQRSPNARYLVLYTSPLGGVPREFLWDGNQQLMAPLIHKEFISPWYRMFQLPTLAASKEVINYVYYLGQRFKHKDEPLSANRGYLAFKSVFQESSGWTRETDVEKDVPANIYNAILPGLEVNGSVSPEVIRKALSGSPRLTDEQFFDWQTLSHSSYFDLVYGAFVELAREHGVKLVVIFNPMPESSAGSGFDEYIDWNGIKAGLDRVSKKYPEAVFTGIDLWPDHKFSVFSHVSTLYSHESSHRVGRIMRQIIGNQRPGEQNRRMIASQAKGQVEIDFSQPYCGYGFTDEEGETGRFPFQYVGQRDKGWLWKTLTPGSAYKVRSVFHAGDPELAGRIQLQINGIPVRKLGTGMAGDATYAEYLVPEAVVNEYRGWLQFEFDLRNDKTEESPQRTPVAFQRIIAVPLPSD